jgi:hypothetical protein
MDRITRFKIYTFAIAIAFLGLYIAFANLKKELKETKDELAKCQMENFYIVPGDISKGEAQTTIDSLNNELFILSTTVGRYEITIDHLKEVNPKAYEQFDRYLQTQTE